MRNAFRIFRRDLKRILRNPAALLVIIGVSIIPSLYAWFNIVANIDPYANTSGIKVAVANNDQEASSNGLSINAGDEIITNLKENDQLGWTFVSEDEAVEGVRSGKYYAAIGKLNTPELEYYINEKANAIAPKITGTGASTIQSQINSTFSSVAAESVSDVVKNSVTDVADAVGNVNTDINEMLKKADANIQAYEDLLDKFNNSSDSTKDLISDAQKAAGSLDDAAASGASALDDADTIIQNTRTAAGDFSAILSWSLSNGELLLNQAHSSASEGLTELEAKAGKINTTVGDALDSANSVVSLNGEILNNMQDLVNQVTDEVDGQIANDIIDRLNSNIASLQEQNDKNQKLIDSLTVGNNSISDAISTTSTTREQLSGIASDSIGSIHAFRISMAQNVIPELDKTLDTFSSLTGELSGLLNGVPTASEQFQSVFNQLDTSLADIRDAALASVSGKLNDIQSDVNALVSSDAYNKLLKLEGIDADQISEFMASPVELDTETYFAVKNYGSSMIPFYSNLAIWVGGIVLIAIIKMEVDRDKSMKNYTASEMYMGRWLLYVVIGIIQGFVVCLGDTLLPGAQVVHPVRMVILGMSMLILFMHCLFHSSISARHCALSWLFFRFRDHQVHTRLK